MFPVESLVMNEQATYASERHLRMSKQDCVLGRLPRPPHLQVVVEEAVGSRG